VTLRLPRGRNAPGPRWDAVQIVLVASLLQQVWRLQDLFHWLRLWGLPIGLSVASLLLFALDHDSRRRLRLDAPIVRIACGIFCLVVLSIPGSLYPGESFAFFIKEYWRAFLLLVLIAGSARTLLDVERVAAAQLAGAALFCVIVLSRYTVGTNGRLGELEDYDTNDLALVIVCTLPLAIYVFARSRQFVVRGAVLVAGACLMATLAKTGSRGGFVGLLAVMGYLAVFGRAVPVGKRLAAVAVTLLFLVTFASSRYWDMMQTILHPTSDYNWSGQGDIGRMELWKRGLGYMAAYPFLGVGASAYSSAEGTLAPQAARQEHGIGFKWSTAHNSFLEIGVELGVLGLVLFVAGFVSGFRTLARIGRGPPGRAPLLAQTLGASLAGYAVSGFFLSAAYWPYLYALLGMIAALDTVAAPHAAPRPARAAGWRSAAQFMPQTPGTGGSV